MRLVIIFDDTYRMRRLAKEMIAVTRGKINVDMLRIGKVLLLMRSNWMPIGLSSMV